MVRGRSLNLTGGFTLIEVIVSMVLSGVIFTGIMATSTITMERISNSLRVENEERQMDRAQMEISFFLSRAAEYRVFSDRDAAGAVVPTESGEGNYLECWPQSDPLEPMDIEKVVFSLDRVSGVSKFVIEVTKTSGEVKSYTYSYNISPVMTPALDGTLGLSKLPFLFRKRDDGFLEYQWKLDSGYGIESFSNMAIPRASL